LYLLIVFLPRKKGYISDRFDRKKLIILAVIGWSLCAGSHCFAKTYWQFFIGRLGVGFFEAIFAPASVSLLTDYFAEEERGKANGILNAGIYLGTALSSLSLFMNDAIGWRFTYTIAGGLGIVVLPFFIIIASSPHRVFTGDIDKSIISSIVKRIVQVFSIGPYRWIMFAAFFRSGGGFVTGFYIQTCFFKKFPDSDQKDTFSIMMAVYMLVCGPISTIWGGWITDRFSKTDVGMPSRLCGLAQLLTIPFVCGTLLFENFELALASLGFMFLIGECWISPAIVMVQNSIPSVALGVSIGMFEFVGNMAGSLSTFLVGYADIHGEGIGTGVQRLDYIILAALCIAYTVSGLLFIFPIPKSFKNHMRYRPQSTIAHDPATDHLIDTGLGKENSLIQS